MASKYALKVGSRSIPLVAANDKINLKQVSEFKPLLAWAKNLAKEEAAKHSDANADGTPVKPPVSVVKVEVKSVDYFGPRIGFTNLAVDATLTESGQKPPGLVFMVMMGIASGIFEKVQLGHCPVILIRVLPLLPNFVFVARWSSCGSIDSQVDKPLGGGFGARRTDKATASLDPFVQFPRDPCRDA
jgi:hypothetical protein